MNNKPGEDFECFFCLCEKKLLCQNCAAGNLLTDDTVPPVSVFPQEILIYTYFFRSIWSQSCCNISPCETTWLLIIDLCLEGFYSTEPQQTGSSMGRCMPYLISIFCEVPPEVSLLIESIKLEKKSKWNWRFSREFLIWISIFNFKILYILNERKVI